MNFKEFSEQALKTESKPQSLAVNDQIMLLSMSASFELSAYLDLIKKAAFYGKKIPSDQLINAAKTVSGVMDLLTDCIDKMDDITLKDFDFGDCEVTMRSAIEPDSEEAKPVDLSAMNLRLAHAVVGAVTESGELMGALLDSVVNGEPVDKVNVSEEYADLDWYKAVAFDELGLTEEASRAAVLAKLAKRYKGGQFNAQEAEVRDLKTEREVLEKNQ